MADHKRPESMERITTPALAEQFIAEQVAAVRAPVSYTHLTYSYVFEKAADSGDEKFNSYIEGLKEQTSQHISQQTEKTIEK